MKQAPFPKLANHPKVDMLLGNQAAVISCSIKGDVHAPRGEGPIARLTPLGWCVVSTVGQDSSKNGTHSVHYVFEQLSLDLANFDDVLKAGFQPPRKRIDPHVPSESDAFPPEVGEMDSSFFATSRADRQLGKAIDFYRQRRKAHADLKAQRA